MLLVCCEHINRIIDFFRHLRLFGSACWDTTESVLVVSSCCGHFCMLWWLKQSVHRSLPPLQKCSNLKKLWSPLWWTSRFVAAKQPWSQSSWLQNRGHNSEMTCRTKVQDVNDLMQHLINAWAGVERHCWWCYWPVAQASPICWRCYFWSISAVPTACWLWFHNTLCTGFSTVVWSRILLPWLLGYLFLDLYFCFNSHFCRWTWVSRYQNVSLLDFIGS